MRAVPDQIAQWVPGTWASLGADGFGVSDTRGATRRFFHIDAPSIVVQVLGELARRDEIKPELVSEAFGRYRLDEVRAADTGETGGEVAG